MRAYILPLLASLSALAHGSPFRDTVPLEDEQQQQEVKDSRRFQPDVKRTLPSFPTCTHEGQSYEPMDDMPHPDPCASCHCGFSGHPICMMVMCAQPRCVDYEEGPDICCPGCPNGPNCWLDVEIIPAFEVKKIKEGDCTRLCKCPHSYNRQKDTRAVCKVVCKNAGQDENEVDPMDF